MGKAIIVDLDNTIFDQNPRKAFILQEKLNRRDISLKDIQQDYTLLSVMENLSEEEKDKFWKNFFSPSYYNTPDGSKLPCFPGCKEALTKLALKYKILYVTARPDLPGQKQEILEEIKLWGLPQPSENELFIMKNFNGLTSHENFKEKAKYFKRSTLSDLANKYELYAGIGDTLDDIEAYTSTGILAIQFLPYGSTQQRISSADLVMKSWYDIGNSFDLLEQDGHPLNKLLEQHIAEYAGWLSDLDSKSRFLLIINTALLAISLEWLRKDLVSISLSTAAKSFMVAVSVTAVVAMIFCIRAFSSRRIRGRLGGQTASTGLYIRMLRDIWKCLIGSKPMPPGSPIEIADKLRQASHTKQKVSHIQFFVDNYGTADFVSVRNLRLYELRSMNYVKIYGEQLARRFTFLTILLLICAMFLTLYKSPQLLDKVNNVTTTPAVNLSSNDPNKANNVTTIPAVTLSNDDPNDAK